MAAEHFETDRDGCGSLTAFRDEVVETTKRCSSKSPDSAPPNKSPRMEDQFHSTQTSAVVEQPAETDQSEVQADNTDGSSDPIVNPTTRRKSFRRATVTRRSLPALPNQYQILCRSISTSSSQQERLEKLMEASMKLALERTGDSLQSVPNASLESFHKQVEHMQKEWKSLAQTISSDSSSESSRDPLVQRAMEKVRKAIESIQTESEGWEALLEKHRTKAQELEREVERGMQTGVPLDSTSVAQSSQYLLIQNKPDYHSLLRRQQPLLNTVSLIMDTQIKMVRQLVFIKEQAQILVKETSARMASEAGLQDLSPDIMKKLMSLPLSSTTA
ncbi:hypothetical protein fugu_014998 [Takifugu bimaculatus]|uniref:DSN1 component of MIS12 kinetochore complex n=1 Tax=Takifugu bimaculatus TaxID=433685 RepID=A0A4Z2BXR5_9TELE|nr:hypothetical protein fugu_014998 [Takifugu bimaculatus]